MVEMRNLLNNPRPFNITGWQSVNAQNLTVASRWEVAA